MKNFLLSPVILFILLTSTFVLGQNQGTVSGELKKWHKVTIEFDGPSTSETANPNPFTDYRLQVTFTNGNTSYNVPGFYAADGNADESSAASGNKWQVHFAPDRTGTWTYTASFRSGSNVALDLSSGAGNAAGFMDGATGSFSIAPTDKTGRDHRGKGRLVYVGEHYLQHQETGDFFIKAGADAPENKLAYDDFDSVPNRGNRRKSWQPHQQDYNAADAQSYTWKNGSGTELLGAINYLSNKGMNVFSFLTFSLHGDDENVFPHLLRVPVSTYNGFGDGQQWNDGVHHDRMDISRLAQWENIFEYADRRGMFMHFKTMETENDNIMDGNSFGNERKLYYRELIARFGHHLALNWNLSEEITLSTSVIQQTADYIRAIDPYDHLLVFHTFPDQKDRYDAHYGPSSSVDGASVQTGDINNLSRNRNDLLDIIDNSLIAGKKWVVGYDEPGTASIGIDNDPDAIKDTRHKVVWNALMAGSCGVEFYYGYQTSCTDLNCQDHRTRDIKYTHANHALEFFYNYLPFHEMVEMDNLTGSSDDFAFVKPNEVYAVYRPNGGSTSINLPTGGWQVQWYNPRTGGNLSSPVSISNQLTAPDGNDWTALITQACQPEGTACNDGDDCTVNDQFDDNCNCLGASLPDNDNDGVCDAEDQCPGFDDSNDSDSDNIPDGCDSCNNNLAGTPCDDGDSCTTNDLYDSNCNCAGESGDLLNVIALEDAYLQGGSAINIDILRIENGNRVSYLKFDLSGINDPILNIELELFTESDSGNGTIQIFASNNTNWSESNLTSSNAPSQDILVGTLTGNYAIGQSYTAQLAGINTNNPFSLILVQSPGGNDVAFASTEFSDSSKHPVLVVNVDNDCNPTCTPGSACDDGNDCTEGETYDTNCQCVGGTLLDTDNDGVCDIDDECPGFDDALDTNGNGIPDGCEQVDPDPCPNFVESNGLVVIEAENIDITGTNWQALTTFSGYTGGGHLVWKGADNFSTPGNGLIEAEIDITTPGTYRFQWRNRIGQGSNTTEHNDSWLRFPDADAFFAEMNGSILYPTGSGQSPNPAGAGSDGWLKVYLSSSTTWTWATLTSDNNGHNIFVSFDNPGTYTMQISGRSHDHVIDRMVMYLPSVSNPTNLSLTESDCDDNQNCSVGSVCDDGDSCTINDVFDSNCNCVGVNETESEIVALEDAYLQNGALFNNEILRIENGNRVSYMKFDVSSISNPIESMSLQLSTESDAGNGTIQVYASNNVNWSESTLNSSNAPSQDQLVGTFTGTFSIGQSYTIDLTSITNTGQFSLILVQSPGGNDVAFASTEFTTSSKHPKLIVSSQGCDSQDNCLQFVVNDDNEINANSIFAIEYIESNNVIPVGSDVEYEAGQSILLTQGFEVRQDAIFLAHIGSCD